MQRKSAPGTIPTGRARVHSQTPLQRISAWFNLCNKSETATAGRSTTSDVQMIKRAFNMHAARETAAVSDVPRVPLLFVLHAGQQGAGPAGAACEAIGRRSARRD